MVVNVSHPPGRSTLYRAADGTGGGELVIAVSEALRADHAAPLRAHALRLTRSETAAADLVRRTFARAGQCAELVDRDPMAVRRWLFAGAGRLASETPGPARTEGD